MRVITVSQLNKYVKMLLESDSKLTSIYISGEISNFTNHYKSGHLYLTLKDEGALVRAVMFRAYASKLKFAPENGMKVIVRARVSLYEKDGSFQIYIEEMQPDGVGALQIAYEQLKKRLAAEGLFDENRKLKLPKYPERIGVITSPTGAAVRDIFNVLGRRYPMAKVIFAPVLVQGDGAPPQLIKALKWFDKTRAADVIIIGRGGGSIEELWAFNDEGVARAVASMHIPVISAVGHETDFTICDFVADLRAPTPSAAAELAVPDYRQLLSMLAHMQVIARRNVRSILDASAQRLAVAQSRRCLKTPLFYVEEQAMRLDYITRAFINAAQKSIVEYDRRLSGFSAKLDALSPLKVLARGYAIASSHEKIIKSVNDVSTGDKLSLRVSDGIIDCSVDSLKEN
ncbi:MAG: exodeoxyribonuclease VII large subunit [Oscillospiraceae bacterium]|nr:exodeoxyribonuclease VII large subunit [Oscillospiraceae bacterium]